VVGIFEHYVGSGDPPWCTPGHHVQHEWQQTEKHAYPSSPRMLRGEPKICASSLIAEDRGRPASTVGSQSNLVTKINISDKSCLVQEYQTRASEPERFTYLYEKCTCSMDDSSSEQWITDIIYYLRKRQSRLSFSIFSINLLDLIILYPPFVITLIRELKS